jgi:mono/diheme cytochrome c family protein
MQSKWTALLLLPVAAMLTACPDRTDEPPAQPPAADAPGAPAAPMAALPAGVTQEQVQQGQQLFVGQGVCFTCHGMQGEGTPLGPGMRDQDWINLTDGSLEEIATVIRTGVSAPQQYPGVMPPMGGAQLNDDQVEALAAYVYALSHGAI